MTVRLAIEACQNPDSAGRLLPCISSNAVHFIKMPWNRAIMHHIWGVNVVARQQGSHSFEALRQCPSPPNIRNSPDRQALAVSFAL
jgi:hypothetical protein